MTARRRAATFAALVALAAGAGAQTADPGSADDPTAVPYRPSVSAPAALSAPGWVELEAGYAHEHAGDGLRRQSLPYTVKLAFTPDWGLRVGGEAWARQKSRGASARSGFGDTGIVAKRQFAVDDDQAFGIEAGMVVPTGRRALHSGSGQADYGLAGIWSADLARWHVDANLVATRLGQPEPGSGRVEWLYALALSHPLGESFGVVAEISGTQRRDTRAARQLLAAASWSVGQRLVLDAGAARSLRGGAPEWQAFAGLTWTAWQLF